MFVNKENMVNYVYPTVISNHSQDSGKFVLVRVGFCNPDELVLVDESVGAGIGAGAPG